MMPKNLQLTWVKEEENNEYFFTNSKPTHIESNPKKLLLLKYI